jgi:plasmid stabilization system protein ParE
VTGYRLLPPAEEEMTEAALFYEAAKTGLGDPFLDDVQRAIDTVRERPHLGVAVSYGFRRALIRRFPFSLIYALEGDEIVVIAVAHQRRSPNYWKVRI